MQYLPVYGALFAFSICLYGNTWSAGFAFDDNFAVVCLTSAVDRSYGSKQSANFVTQVQVSNGDVTGSASLAGILHHDFWYNIETFQQVAAFSMVQTWLLHSGVSRLHLIRATSHTDH